MYQIDLKTPYWRPAPRRYNGELGTFAMVEMHVAQSAFGSVKITAKLEGWQVPAQPRPGCEGFP